MLPLLPLYAFSLGATPLELGLMTSGFAIANGVAQFASGSLMDRFGARRFMVLLLLPAEIRPEPSPAPRAPEASGTPASR